MFLKHLAYCVLLNISLNICILRGKETSAPETGQKLLKSAIELMDNLMEFTPYLNSTLNEITTISPSCVQMMCKFVCFKGNAPEIENDILMISQMNNYFCFHIEELRLYGYYFPNNKISHGFLGNYSNKVVALYIASSNVTDIEGGAFAGGIFREIYFESLQLKELKKDMFEGISHKLNKLSVVQPQLPVQWVHRDFFCYINYQIKYLILQAGLTHIGNITGGDFLLNNLVYVDFSHNNLEDGMKYTNFNQASMIEQLDLSHSNLEYLPVYIFAGLTKTLKYLNLSHNKLKVITRNIFDWAQVRPDFKIYAHGNDWWCSCQLQAEMLNMFIYYTTSLNCYMPERYRGWSVFDIKICQDTSGETTEIITDFNDTTTNEGIVTTSANDEGSSPKPLLNINCLAYPLNISQHISLLMQRPSIEFKVLPQQNLTVNVVINPSLNTYDAFKLIWFSKYIMQCHQMKANYSEYGFGCYKSNISALTVVENLIPKTSYTFCLVLKKHSQVSPFDCKSIYVRDDLAIESSAWLTSDMRGTGLSLVVVGIIMFIFAGILMIYLIFKRQPLLLTNSKRATPAMDSNNSDEKVSSKKKKENKFFGCGLFHFNSQKRRQSIDGAASNESCIYQSFYEVIPAFGNRKVNGSNNLTSSALQPTVIAESNSQDRENCYLTPLESFTGSPDIVEHGAKPCITKCNSYESLPQIPADPAPHSLALRETQAKSEYARIGNIYILDSQV